MVEIADSVAEKVAEYLLAPVVLPFSYLWNYNSNFENLKKEVHRLEDWKEKVQFSVEEALREGEEISNYVKNWLDSVAREIHDASQFIHVNEAGNMRCCKGLCPNLKKRYQNSKKAVRISKDALQLYEEGKFARVSYRTLQKESWIPFSRGYETFESRTSIFKDILNALINPDVNIVGVYGAGGIGKTVLVREVAIHSEDEHIFDVVVFVEVSEKPDIRNIQQEIADKLGLMLRADTESGRARELCVRLKNFGKVLLILDNVWKGLDLERVGIPFGVDHKGCKLLLTARRRDALEEMKSEEKFEVGMLTEEEAWNLFKKKIGASIEDQDMQSIAFDVAKACGGLPIAIVSIALALRNRAIFEWKDALQQLRSSTHKNLEGVAAHAYSCLEISYQQLESKELKSTFLLCSMMEYTDDDDASVEDLLRYGLSLDLFQQINTIEDARDRVAALVEELKTSSLLLDTPNSERFTMHDIVLDVARLIASRDQHMLALSGDSLFQNQVDEDRLKYCTALSLHNVSVLPERLECPQLKFLYMKTNDPLLEIPDNFFSGIQELRVLHLIRMNLLLLPASFCLLKNLRTLCMDQCKLQDVAFIGHLKELQLLSLHSFDIEKLPGEIVQLKRLRLLDLTHCSKLKFIPPKVISYLTKLEVLYLGNTSIQWEAEGLNKERSYSSLEELKQSCLTALEIHIQDAKLVPKDVFFNQLVRYKIVIGDNWGITNWHKYERTTRMLKFKLNTSINFKDDIIFMQLRGIRDLCLDEMSGVRSVHELDRKGFLELEHLEVQNNPSFLFIVDNTQLVSFDVFPVLESLFLSNLIDLRKICDGQLKEKSFHLLRIIEVQNCDKLKNVFSFSIAKVLPRLEEIKVTECKNMEEIFAIGNGEDVNNSDVIDEIWVNQLRSVTLEYLPQLISFCSRETLHSSQKKVLTADTRSEKVSMDDELESSTSLFNKNVVFPNLEALKLSAVFVETIWHNQLPVTYNQNLTRLIVQGCGNLRHLFSSSKVNSFVKLQYLKICECTALEKIIVVEEALREEFHSGNHIEFPSLKELEIENCPELKAFIFNNKVGFPSLEKMIISCMDNLESIWHDQLVEDSFWKLKSLEVNDCQKLSTVFPSCICERLLRLESLIVKCCGSVEKIYDLRGPNFEEQQEITSCHLRELYIDYLPNLKYIWNKDSQVLLSLENLKKVTIFLCWSLKYLFPASVASSLLLLESLEVSYCGVEEIVAKEVVEEIAAKFVFPLRSLQLHRLPELITFYPGLHTLECPVLERLGLHYCDKVKRSISEFLSLRDTNEDQIDISVEQPFFLLPKLSFGNLKELELSGEATLLILQNKVPEDLFYTLKILELTDTDSKTTVLPLGIQEFRNLEKLSLNSGSYIEIFSYEEVKKHAQMLPSINHLALNRLFDLKQIWKHDSSKMDLNFQNLETLEVRSCVNLISLMPSSASFQNLRILEVWGCEVLKNLLTSSTAKSLTQLEKLEVFDCKMMIEVVENEGAMTKIIFSKLKSLSLMYLQNLSSFCSVKHVLDFPILESLVVNECPKMKSFSEGITSTPSLRKLELDWKAIEHSQEVDLNTNIQRDREKGLPGREDCSDPSVNNLEKEDSSL